MGLLNTIDTGILNFIYSRTRNALFDILMPFISRMGNGGAVWVLSALLLLFMPNYSKCGLAMAISLILCVVIGNLTLKPLFARTRPCDLNPAITLLIRRPTDYSFPSGHTMSSFAAATILLLSHKELGMLAMILASLIAFSRLYLYVHHPSDILVGALIGIAIARVVMPMMPFVSIWTASSHA
ncbi:MAG: phosphatase PAP2 family protein [Evtepia sp.]